MKTITPNLPSGGPSSSSPSGPRPARDPALSRPLPKRFRPGGAAPMRKKSFRHHLDQTLGKEGVPPVVPVHAEPPAVSPESLSRGGKVERPKSRTALVETRAPEPPSKPAGPSSAPAPVSPEDGIVRKDNSLSGGVRTKPPVGKNIPGVRPGKSPLPAVVSRDPAPSEIVPGPAGASFLQGPKKKDPSTLETGSILPPSGQARGKTATLPAKGVSSLKEKGTDGISPSRQSPESVQNVFRQDETVPEAPPRQKDESFFEEKMPEDVPGSAPLNGGEPPEMHRETLPLSADRRGSAGTSRDDTSQVISPVVSGAPPAFSPENADPKTRVEVPEFSRKVVDTVRSGGGEVTLRVHPPALGPVQVHVQMDEGGKSVSLSIRVRDESVRKALVSSGKMLRDRLEKEGFSLARMDVSTVSSGTPVVVSGPNATDSATTLPSSSFQADAGGSQTSFSGRESGGRESPGLREPGEVPLPDSARTEIMRRRPVIEEAGYHRIA